MRNQYKLIFIIAIVITMTSCGSFGEGMLMGLANYGSTYGSSYGSTYGSTTTTNTAASNPLYFDWSTVDWSTVPASSTPTTTTSGYSSSGSYSSGSSSTSSSSGTSSQKICRKLSASDNAHCGGSGICSRCNGKGKYYDTSYGISKWIDCKTCYGSGKCPSCGGTGRR